VLGSVATRGQDSIRRALDGVRSLGRQAA